MIRSNELSIDDWFKLIMEHLKFETEEQTFSVILDEVLYTWRHGLLSDERIQEIFSMVSKLELTVVDNSLKSKGALINSFCSEIVASGQIMEPKEITPTSCYEVIGYQCKSKAQVYTFFRLLFANPEVDLETKNQFLHGL